MAKCYCHTLSPPPHMLAYLGHCRNVLQYGSKKVVTLFLGLSKKEQS